ncbi:hypothetical protein VQ056_06285 [Paenibacillus sp. JTLBN-2024]
MLHCHDSGKKLGGNFSSSFFDFSEVETIKNSGKSIRKVVTIRAMKLAMRTPSILRLDRIGEDGAWGPAAGIVLIYVRLLRNERIGSKIS